MRCIARSCASSVTSPQASAITYTSKPWSSADSAGPTMQTLVHRPPSTIRLLPDAFTAATTAASSQQFMVVRSSTSAFGNASGISGNSGPEKDFSATVVSKVETPNPAAPLATSATLLRSMATSIECVAKAICD